MTPSTQWNTVLATWPSQGVAALFDDANQNEAIDAGELCSIIFIVSPSRAAAVPSAPAAGGHPSRSRVVGAVASVGARLPRATGVTPARTPEGVTLGTSNRANVHQAYGNPEDEADGTDWYWARGIAFAYDDPGVVALLVLFGRSAGASRADVEPGDHIGELHVGGRYADARAAYGDPSAIAPSGTWIRASWSSRGLDASYEDANGNKVPDPDERCMTVFAVSPYSGRTDKGIGVGSTRAGVVQAYGAAEQTTPLDGGASADWYWTSGMVFAYGSNGVVEMLAVFAPKMPAEPAPQGDIVPSTRVAKLQVGGAVAAALSAYGHPSIVNTASETPGVVYAFWPSVGLSVVVQDSNGNEQLDASEVCIMAVAAAPYRGRTQEGIGLGSTRQAATSAFGAAEEVAGSVDWYWSKGIALTYGPQGVVDLISVFPKMTEDVIEPGVRMGGLRINGTFADAQSAYGTPTTIWPDDSNPAMFATWEDRGLGAVFADSNRNQEIDAGEPCVMLMAAPPYSGRTSQGVGVGSTRQAVRAALGTPEQTDSETDWYQSKGIGCFYDTQGTVSLIAVFAPTTAEVIEPAVRAGGARVGGTFADVKGAYGAPDNTWASTSSAVMYASWSSRGLSLAFTDSNGNKVLENTEPCLMVVAAAPFSGRTSEGIGIGSTRTAVRAAFGTAEQVEGSVEWYWSKGINFRYDSASKVTAIAIFAPPASSTEVIEPAVRMGDLKVGRPFSEARTAYGSPERTVASSSQWIMNAYWDSRGLSAAYGDADEDEVLDSTETCIMAFARSPFAGKTSQGIGIGSTRAAVSSSFGAAEEVAGGVEWYWSEGINFQYDSTAKVAVIAVFPVVRSAGRERLRAIRSLWAGRAAAPHAQVRRGDPSGIFGELSRATRGRSTAGVGRAWAAQMLGRANRPRAGSAAGPARLLDVMRRTNRARPVAPAGEPRDITEALMRRLSGR